MRNRTLVFYIGLTGFVAWVFATSFGPELRYERLVWGMLAAWLVGVRVWADLRSRTSKMCGFIWAWLCDLFFSLSPGAILVWYGASAPASPSYARGGMDVCDLEPGFCVSGTRAFVGFGIELLVIGAVIAVALLLLKPKQRPSGRPD